MQTCLICHSIQFRFVCIWEYFDRTIFDTSSTTFNVTFQKQSKSVPVSQLQGPAPACHLMATQAMGNWCPGSELQSQGAPFSTATNTTHWISFWSTLPGYADDTDFRNNFFMKNAIFTQFFGTSKNCKLLTAICRSKGPKSCQ